MRRLALLFSAAVILISLSTSAGFRGLMPLVNALPGRDLTCHFVLMGLLSFLVVAGFEDARFRGRKLGALGCALVIALGATLDEFFQLATPARTFSLTDLAANYAGIASFSWLASRLRRRFARVDPAVRPSGSQALVVSSRASDV